MSRSNIKFMIICSFLNNILFFQKYIFIIKESHVEQNITWTCIYKWGKSSLYKLIMWNCRIELGPTTILNIILKSPLKFIESLTIKFSLSSHVTHIVMSLFNIKFRRTRKEFYFILFLTKRVSFFLEYYSSLKTDAILVNPTCEVKFIPLFYKTLLHLFHL